jgi:hypothetical protein
MSQQVTLDISGLSPSQAYEAGCILGSTQSRSITCDMDQIGGQKEGQQRRSPKGPAYCQQWGQKGYKCDIMANEYGIS